MPCKCRASVRRRSQALTTGMCGRYVSPDRAAIERAWNVGRDNGNPFAARYNVQPSTLVPMLRPCEAGGLEIAFARWGLVPHWWKQSEPPKFSFNARAEEAAVKPMWRHPFRHARCLIPAEGWYEWQQRERLNEAEGEVRVYKQPYFIRRRDHRPVCFAGLMAWWVHPETHEGTLSCAILTTAASGALTGVHERMPVTLPDGVHAAWLDPNTTSAEGVSGFLRARSDADAFEHYAVSTRVNSSRAEGPGLIDPLPH